MDDYYRPRSRSQSRRHEDEHFNVPIDRSQRSKSLDNRKEFQRDNDDPFYDPPAGAAGGGGGFRDTFHASIPKRHYERRFGGGDERIGGGGGGDDFFNETITIPRSTVKVSPDRHNPSMDPDKNELAWSSYDKSSNYRHERTVHPPAQQYYRYEEYGGGGDRLLAHQQQHAEISPRSYPESDYYQRAQIQRPYYDGRSADAASAYRVEQQRYYEEERERGEHAARAERERAERVLREQREVEEKSRTIVKNGKNGHGGSHGYSYQASGYSRGGASGFRGGRGGFVGRGGKPERQYHRITCCCFRFYWPPWGYEPVEPVQPWYPRPSSRAGSPTPPPIEKQPR